MLKVKYHFLISNSLEIYVFLGNVSSNEKETVNLKKAFGLWRDSQTGRFQKLHLYSHVLDKDLVSASELGDGNAILSRLTAVWYLLSVCSLYQL